MAETSTPTTNRKAPMVAVDYQLWLHNGGRRPRRKPADDGASGALEMAVMVLSAGLFLSALHVAVEAPWEAARAAGDPVHADARTHAHVQRPGLAMTARRDRPSAVVEGLGDRDRDRR